MLRDRAAVDEYARKLGAVAVSGYTGQMAACGRCWKSRRCRRQEIAEMAAD